MIPSIHELLCRYLSRAVRCTVLGCALFFVWGGTAHTAIVYNNFGPGDTYNTGGGSSINASVSPGFAFTPSFTTTLGTIDVAVNHLLGTSDEFDLFFMSDVGGKPGVVVESFHFSNATAFFGSSGPPVTAVSLLHPALVMGTQYWVVAGTSDAGAALAWMDNSTGAVGPSAFELSGPPPAGPWTSNPSIPNGAFRITDTVIAAVPEPPLPELFAIGLGVLLFQRRLKRT